VTVRTYWAWEATATLRPALGHPRGEERGGAYRVAMRTACITLRYELSRKVAVDLLAAPASQAFVEAVFCLWNA